MGLRRSMTLQELHSRVSGAVKSDVDIAQVAQYILDARDKLDQNATRWAIEDEAEREEWQDLLVLGAANAFMSGRKKKKC